jgi:TPR repeat protein
MDEKGLGTQKDLNNAIELYTNACDGGNSSACFNLSAIYEKQNDNFKNVEFLTKACNLEHAKACHNLAYKYYNEEGVELAPVKAITLI